jgi:hypothetical protein
MTALQRGRYIGPVWIGIQRVPREHRIIIDTTCVQYLTADQARKLGEQALALADELQARLGPARPLLRTHDLRAVFERAYTAKKRNVIG